MSKETEYRINKMLARGLTREQALLHLQLELDNELKAFDKQRKAKKAFFQRAAKHEAASRPRITCNAKSIYNVRSC